MWCGGMFCMCGWSMCWDHQLLSLQKGRGPLRQPRSWCQCHPAPQTTVTPGGATWRSCILCRPWRSHSSPGVGRRDVCRSTYHWTPDCWRHQHRTAATGQGNHGNGAGDGRYQGRVSLVETEQIPLIYASISRILRGVNKHVYSISCFLNFCIPSLFLSIILNFLQQFHGFLTYMCVYICMSVPKYNFYNHNCYNQPKES